MIRRMLIVMSCLLWKAAPRWLSSRPRRGRRVSSLSPSCRQPATACRALPDRRVRLHLGSADGLPLVDLEPPRKSGEGHPCARTAIAEEHAPVTAGHFIFIPAVILVGVAIGWILGSRAARDAYAMELKRREERAAEGGRLKSGRKVREGLAPLPYLSFP